MNEQDNPASEVVSEDTETSIDTQESQTEEVSETSEETSQEASEENVDGTQQAEEEWIIPGRFRKGEEHKLAESYRNLESEYSRRGNELYQLRNQVSQPKVDPAEKVQRFAEAVKRDPVEAIESIIDSKTQNIVAEVEQAKFEVAVQKKMSNKEFAELEPVMTQVAKNLAPVLTPEQKRNPEILDWLFYIAKGLKTDEVARRAEKSGVKKGEKAAIKKSKAITEGSSGSKGHVKKPFSELNREEMRRELAKGRLQD